MCVVWFFTLPGYEIGNRFLLLFTNTTAFVQMLDNRTGCLMRIAVWMMDMPRTVFATDVSLAGGWLKQVLHFLPSKLSLLRLKAPLEAFSFLEMLTCLGMSITFNCDAMTIAQYVLFSTFQKVCVPR